MFRPLLLAAALSLPAPAVLADVNPGAYLAARQAQMDNDYREATRYLTQAMLQDPNNLAILEQLTGAFMSLGEIDRADTIALRLAQEGGTSQLANLALLTERAKQGDWADILADMDAGMTVGPLFDGLAKAWALVGDRQIDAALAAFDAVAEEDGLAAYGTYHKGLALASLGRFDEAEALFSTDDLQLTRRGLMAHAQVLTQVGRFDEAAAVLDAGFGGGTLDAPLTAMKEAIAEGQTLDFTIAPDATAGTAELAFDIANVLLSEAAPAYTLLYGRVVEYLRPDHVEALLMNTSLLEQLEQYDLAIEALAAVPEDDPAFTAAEVGRAEILATAGRPEEGIAVLRQMAEEHPDVAMVHMTLGDALRNEEMYAEAQEAYTDAIDLFSGDEPDFWVAFFARAVTHERLDDWPAAKSDFRRALDLNPDSPAVLNYLGYSMLERGEDFEEALSMIERAVEARPQSGAIVDSLGWGLYRLGRFDEAVEPMERAVALMPVDPVVNDHLGDVYWMVGRKLEARFQWQRALSFVENDQNDEVDPDRIRRKLEVGLDVVLEEEDGTPLVAEDGG